MKNKNNQYVFRIQLSPDSTFGESNPSELKFKPVLQTTNGCKKGIPTTYQLLNLPVEQPQIEFRKTSITVPLCSNKFVLDIFSSKGLTMRKPKSIVWNVVSIDTLTTSAERNTLDAYVNSNFANMKFVSFDQVRIASLASKIVEIKAAATNFLDETGDSNVIVTFLNVKKIVIEGLYPSYLLVDNEDQKLFLSARIPYCSGENRQTILDQEKNLVIDCALYESDGTTLVASLTKCKIPIGSMIYPNTYKLKVSASNPADASQSTVEWSDIHVKKANLTVFIHGGDRAISVSQDMNFISNVKPWSSTVVYRWSCVDEASNTY